MLISKFIKSVAKIADTKGSRPILGSVCFFPDGRVVATDNHVLVEHLHDYEIDTDDFPVVEPNKAFKWPKKGAKPMNVPADIIRLIKFPKKSNSLPVLNKAQFVNVNPETRRFSIQTNSLERDTTIGGRLINGAFPDYEKVIPDFRKEERVWQYVDCRQLIKVLEVFAAAGGDGEVGIGIATGGDSPMVIAGVGAEKASNQTRALVMPIKHNGGHPGEDNIFFSEKYTKSLKKRSTN